MYEDRMHETIMNLEDMGSEDLMELWNEYADAEEPDLHIYHMWEISEVFANCTVGDFVQRMAEGNFCAEDSYFVTDETTVTSFESLMEGNSPVRLETLAEWIIEVEAEMEEEEWK